jgi:hypothetical protein
MTPIDKIKKHFKSMMFVLEPTEILVLKGLITGDGDIGGRMASSHPDARPPVDKKQMKFLELIAEKHREFGTPLDKLEEIHSWQNFNDHL